MSETMALTLDHIAGPGHTHLVKYAPRPNGTETLPSVYMSEDMYDTLGRPAQLDMTITPRPDPNA